MYEGNLISSLQDIVDRAFAEHLPECTLIDEIGAECGCAAVVLLLPNGDEGRCLKHLHKASQF
jgi:hypothetical protein